MTSLFLINSSVSSCFRLPWTGERRCRYSCYLLLDLLSRARFCGCTDALSRLNGAMAKALTKSQIATTIAERAGISRKQAVQTLEILADLAYKNAKNSFTLPGLGKLVLVNRKARMGRNPATGASIKIPAKRVVKFRVAKAAKDAILGKK